MLSRYSLKIELKRPLACLPLLAACLFTTWKNRSRAIMKSFPRNSGEDTIRNHQMIA